MKELREVNATLETQLCEMEKFWLTNLVWVGSGGEEENEDGKNRQSSATATDKKVYRLGGAMNAEHIEEIDEEMVERGLAEEVNSDTHTISFEIFDKKIKELMISFIVSPP